MNEKKHHESADSLKRVLSLSSLVFYGFAFMVPLTIFTTYALVTNLTHGMVAITYLITTFAMSLTAFSYVKMTKAYPVAGSVYTYVHKSINPYLGFMSGWVVLIGYMFLPMLNYLAAALFLYAAIPQIPSWIWIVGFAAIVTVVNHFGIQVTAIVNKIIVWIQIIFLVALLIIAIKYIVGGGGAGTLFDGSALINFTELGKQGMGLPVLLIGASILALSFLGFDAISTLSEEAINPEKNIGRAIIIACLGAGLAFAFITYILQLAWPNAWFEMVDKEGGAYELISRVAGSLMAYIFIGAYVVGCLASSISSVSSASRILYGMGRDKILPKKIFGFLHPKYKTPTYSILIMGLLSLLAIKLSLVTALSLLNFGALLAFTMVNISVIFHFFIRGKKRGFYDSIRYFLVPLAGAVITFTLWIRLDATSMKLGFVWIGLGIIYLAVTTNFFRKLPAEMKLD